MVAGWYFVDIYEQLIDAPKPNDTLLATQYGYWDGTTFDLDPGATRARLALPPYGPSLRYGLPTCTAASGASHIVPVYVSEMNPDVITAASLKDDAVEKITDAIEDITVGVSDSGVDSIAEATANKFNEFAVYVAKQT